MNKQTAAASYLTPWYLAKPNILESTRMTHAIFLLQRLLSFIHSSAQANMLFSINGLKFSAGWPAYGAWCPTAG